MYNAGGGGVEQSREDDVHNLGEVRLTTTTRATTTTRPQTSAHQTSCAAKT